MKNLFLEIIAGGIALFLGGFILLGLPLGIIGGGWLGGVIQWGDLPDPTRIILGAFWGATLWFLGMMILGGIIKKLEGK